MHPAGSDCSDSVFNCTSQEDFAQSNAEATCDLYADCEVLGVMGDFDDIATCTESIAAELSRKAVNAQNTSEIKIAIVWKAFVNDLR